LTGIWKYIVHSLIEITISPSFPLFLTNSTVFEKVFIVDNRPSGKKSKSSKILRKTWFWIFFGLVLLVVLFFIMLPIGIDYAIKSYLKDQGADQVSLADVDFNPFTGWMGLTDLTVKIGTRTALKIPEATFKIQWTPFIRKRFVLERFTISDTQLTIEEMEDGGWQIGGIKLPDRSDSAKASVWNFSFQEATVNNSKVKFISSRLTSDLKIEQAKISKLTSWMHADSAYIDFTGQLNDAQMRLQMNISPFGSDIKASGQINLKGLALNPFSRLLQPHIERLEGRLDADLKIETHQTAEGGFNHHQKGPVKLHQVHTQIGDMELSEDGMVWEGALRVDIPKSEETLKISADGQLNGSKLALAMQNENIKIQQDNFTWKGKIDYAQKKTNLDLTTDGQISLAAVRMESSAVKLSEEKLSWKGALQFSSTANTEGQRIIADGALNGSHLLVKLLNRKLKLEHQGLSWKGRLDFGETNDLNSLKAEADLILDEVEILNAEKDQPLLNSKQVNLQAIKIDGLDKINVLGLEINGLAVLSEPKAAQSATSDLSVLSIQSLKFEDARLSQQKDLAIDIINLQEVKAVVHRNPQGKWSLIERWDAIGSDVFAADQTRQAASDTGVNKKSEDFGFRIGKVEITGNSKLRFQDESVSPAFSIYLSLLEARLADLDSRRPEKPATVKLLISDGEDARLSLDGSMQPFAEQLNLDWAGKIEALELSPLSPYVIQYTGYRFASGEMQADIPIKINQNQLEGKIDLILYKPTVERVNAEKPPQKKQGKIQLSMSLDSALKLLRDDHNNVKLKIPISGDIRDPQFSVADAVNKVLAQTLQTSALSYLKFMLGPYGIGLSVAEMAYKSASKIRLNPILFAPGSTELDEVAIDYLKRVSAILKEHPTAQVDVCGVATESDRVAQKKLSASTATDATLLELAKNRTKSIENQLVKLHGIEAKRIIVCKPKIDSRIEAKPRVDLEI
jgi:outer membrane protein OmpA-like peptidoglycan-associated protein